MYKQTQIKNSINTGFITLDNKINGINPKELILIAGSPSTGKSLLLSNIIEHIAIYQSASIALFSRDLSAKRYTQRMMSSLASIDMNTIKTGNYTSKQWQKLGEKQSLLDKSKIFIDDSEKLSIEKLRKRCLKLKKSHFLNMVVIDSISNRKTSSEQIFTQLKALAIELNLPVICTIQSQRNSLKIKQQDKDSIDLLLFLYRDEIYNVNTAYRNQLQITVHKANNKVDKVNLHFHGQTMCFDDIFINQTVH